MQIVYVGAVSHDAPGNVYIFGKQFYMRNLRRFYILYEKILAASSCEVADCNQRLVY